MVVFSATVFAGDEDDPMGCAAPQYPPIIKPTPVKPIVTPVYLPYEGITYRVMGDEDDPM